MFLDDIVQSFFVSLGDCRETNTVGLYERATCWQDPNNIASDIMVTVSEFNGDAKCRDIEKIVNQESFPLGSLGDSDSDLSTRCKVVDGMIFDLLLPTKFSCVQSSSDKGPFSVDEPNTFSEV